MASVHGADILRYLRETAAEYGVDERIREIKRTLTRERRTSWSHLKKPDGGLLPIVWIGIALSVFQQFVGINVIFYYSSTLWQAVGFTEEDLKLLLGVANQAAVALEKARLLEDVIRRERMQRNLQVRTVVNAASPLSEDCPVEIGADRLLDMEGEPRAD